MRPEQLGAFHQTRISFARSLLRKIAREEWQIERTRFDLDVNGFGRCIYRVDAKGVRYSLVVLSHYLDPAERSDRVIARKWDVACALCEGDIDAARLAELEANIPLQEAGRYGPRDLVLSRANRSVRNFEHIVECLAEGRQPDPAKLARVGYLLRTTAVYGNGKFGLVDYDAIRGGGAFARPFSAQMFTVYLLRQFSIELVEHLARSRSPTRAVPLDDNVRRYLGTGNATGLGMAPFLLNHPQLVSRWMEARERALARVVERGTVTTARVGRLRELVRRAITHLGETWTDDEPQRASYQRAASELESFSIMLDDEGAFVRSGWQAAVDWAQTQATRETQELIVSLLLELYPELVDDLEDELAAEETPSPQPQMSVDALKRVIEKQYSWALDVEFDRPEEQRVFWYRSAEKEEPRLGEREREPGADQEIPSTTIARTVNALYERLLTLSADQCEASVAAFALHDPDWRGIIRRIQSLTDSPYGEVHANLLHEDCRPIDLLRGKLSMFGATKFDPKSKLWLRITLFQGAPLLDELHPSFIDDWCFPCLPDVVGVQP